MKTPSSKARPAGRLVVTRVYTARHLKRYYPKGYKRAFEQYCRWVSQDTGTMHEILDSLKGVFGAASVRLADWRIGAYSYSSLRAEFRQEGTEHLKGPRALAWLENNLLAQFRAPWGLNTKDGNLHENGDNGKRGKAYRKTWARWYKPGTVRDCPFTGVCFDDDFLDALVKDVRAGATLKEAFEGLADVARKLIEDDDEYRKTDEQFLEDADANQREYTKEGRNA